MTMMEQPQAGYPDSPLDGEDVVYSCKGCGEILEEGKAFELSGFRWHINCFRCNTCATLLDSDANLLLLGDGSLICSNCTYSCSACGNKIEDLAILTGDQAYCAGCFRCRSCKKKIENLRYARTTQGMFCMGCHDALMARRRKKSSRSGHRHRNGSNNAMHLDKSLPSLPPNANPTNHFSSGHETPPSDTFSDTPTELPGSIPPSRPSASTANTYDRSPAPSEGSARDNLTLPSAPFHKHRNSTVSHQSEPADEYFHIPMALDPNTAPGPSPLARAPTGTNGENSKARYDSHELPGDYFNIRPKSTSRQISREARPEIPARSESRGDSQPRSPHVGHQGKAAEKNYENYDTIRRRKPAVAAVENSQDAIAKPARKESENQKFELQEVPKRRKSGSSPQDSKGDGAPKPLDTSLHDLKSKSAPASAHTPLREQHINVGPSESARSSQLMTPTGASPRMPQDSRNADPHSRGSPQTAIPELPKRGDSLQKSATTQGPLTRKEVPSSKSTAQSATSDLTFELPSLMPPPSRPSLESPSASINGGRVISRPIESPVLKNSLDFPPRSSDRPAGGASSEGDSFVSPRVPPNPPVENNNKHQNKPSNASTVRSESGRNGEQPHSPGLPQYHASGEFVTGMNEDFTRILGHDDAEQSFLRRVSKSVRHARSYSDRGSRNSKENKWPRTPLNGSAGGGALGPDFSSPTTSPESKDEVSWLRIELRKERQKVAERDERLEELEAAMEGNQAISQMNTELREKRSTMVVLDTQKEMVIRELEILTEHIAASRKSKEPLDVGHLKSVMVRDFAESLQKYKDSFKPELELLSEKKSDLSIEIEVLEQQRAKAEQEFDQLTLKNSQLADLNNSLVDQIRELHKAGSLSESNKMPNYQGLGIYNHHKEKSNVSIDSHELRPTLAESGMTGSTLSAPDHESEPATILTAPQVVNIRKGGQAKKFNWKKGGNVAKGVTKGIKGAFSSTNEAKINREGSVTGLTEGTPYGAMSQLGDLPTTTLPPKHVQNESGRQGFGFFGQQKAKNGPAKATTNGQLSVVPAADPSILFGSELEQRAEYERVNIPAIITRCIEEVELRGMDHEGVYRKSGGSASVELVRTGFERDNDFDISDPDLDIGAVTSTLKQYFHRLPTPLITYPVYDKLLNSAAAPSAEERVGAMRAAIAELPQRHRDCLEFLVFHLARVVEHEAQNLMSSLNCAVVFAPTIMRPESITREMTDTQAKNSAVQFLIENCYAVFLGEERVSASAASRAGAEFPDSARAGGGGYDAAGRDAGRDIGRVGGGGSSSIVGGVGGGGGFDSGSRN